jgi:AraC family transcriptional regulator, regulatory protein of adaptative response / DNA-3-methyladenine glycosylase II
VQTGHDDALEERCWRAVHSRDARFDGWFVTAVRTTGIYCRPSCPARTPKRASVSFLPTAAAAQAAGFRACKRCRPDASPGSPEWDLRSDLVARAVRLVADGVVDREGVPGLAARLGYSRRQVERALRAELGAGPLALARAQRAQTARQLLESTDLPAADVALAAGFGSVRQFNDTVRAVFGCTPGQLRAGARTAPTPGRVVLRLPFRPPLLPDSLFGHLAATAVPGVEEWRDGAYRRTLRLERGAGVVELVPGTGAVTARVALQDLRDLPQAVARCRRLLDLDADPVAVDAALSADPVLAPLVAAAPGRRVPRAVDAGELALRAVLGQQVSTAAARTHAARLVAAVGTPVEDPDGGLTHLFPIPAEVAGVDPAVLALPHSRRTTLLRLAEALATGAVDLGPGADRERARAQLLGLPGVGPWTVETVAMRGLGDPDAFLPTDLGVLAAARRLGIPDLVRHAERWAPWRAYAVQHLWGTSDHAVNRLPEEAA